MNILLRWLTQKIAQVHEYILRVNDSKGSLLSDKELHLIVMGLLGMMLFFLTFAVFKVVEKLYKHSTMIYSFIFTFTNLVVISFAIEIGQRLSRTGNMEFMDILFGLWGFIILFSGYLLILGVIYLIRRLISKKKRSSDLHSNK